MQPLVWKPLNDSDSRVFCLKDQLTVRWNDTEPDPILQLKGNKGRDIVKMRTRLFLKCSN